MNQNDRNFILTISCKINFLKIRSYLHLFFGCNFCNFIIIIHSFGIKISRNKTFLILSWMNNFAHLLGLCEFHACQGQTFRQFRCTLLPEMLKWNENEGQTFSSSNSIQSKLYFLMNERKPKISFHCTKCVRKCPPLNPIHRMTKVLRVSHLKTEDEDVLSFTHASKVLKVCVK